MTNIHTTDLQEMLNEHDRMKKQPTSKNRDEENDSKILHKINETLEKRVMTYEEYSERFDEPEALTALREIYHRAESLLRQKDKDYEEAWRYARADSHIDRIYQKIRRVRHLQELERKGEKPEVSEGVEQELVDIVNYAAFSLYTIRNGHRK